MKDRNGNILKIGDIVHDKWGYDLVVCYSENMGWHGMLVCDENDSCKDIPYALNEDEITLIKSNRNNN